MALSGEISRMKYLAFDGIQFDSFRFAFLFFFYTHFRCAYTCKYIYCMCVDSTVVFPREGAQLVANNKQI